MRIIITAMLSLLIFMCSYAGANLNDGLIALYTFDGHYQDKSGNHKHGACDGESCPDFTAGKYYKAGYFDGADKILTGIERSSVSDMTICAWYKYQGELNADYSALFGNSNGSFFVGKQSGNADISVQDGTGIPNFVTETDAWDGSWHHMCYMRRESISKIGSLFIDGKRIAEASFSGTNGELFIGYENDHRQYYFKGVIDDVRIYNRGLSEIEINNLYQNEPPNAAIIQNTAVYNNILTLDASKSFDNDGTIHLYEWYLRCRGNSDLDIITNGITAKIMNLQPGFYDANLIVMDNSGATSSSDFIIFSGIGILGDINYDGKIGLEETIYSLQKNSGID